ncbi:MAG: hypothetical protein JW875_02285 [Spirochaetales bacterium]|nr:hypothetical protein [Spirochaetales bacterium]
MKKSSLAIIALTLILGLFTVVPAVAADSDLYYVNVPILKIFPHKLGYYVIYRRAGLKTGEIYIPHAWFDRRDSRAILNLTEQNVTPYLTIVTRNGEFDHIRVVAKKNNQHNTWGTIGQNALNADKFNVEKLNVEY